MKTLYMKKLLNCYIISFLVIIPCTALFADTPFKNAEVQYRLIGKQEGNETLYIKEKQMRSITSMQTAEGESLIVIDIMSISEGNYLTIVDLNQKIGVKLGNPFKKSFSEMSSDEIDEFHRKMLLGVSEFTEFKEIGKEEIMGKDCTIFEVASDKFTNTLWVWNNLILKSKMSGSVSFEKEATTVKIDKKIPDTLFLIPSDVEIVDRTET